MSEVSQPPVATPARRRNGRGQAKSAAQRSYASETDALDDSLQYVAPRTPGEHNTMSPARNGSSQQGNNKSRSKNKGRTPKNSTAASDPSLIGGQPTPHRPSSASTSKATMAFAGATFHASPAPSALPMPSFFQRNAAEPLRSHRTESSAQAPSPAATEPELPTPDRTSSATMTNESPLDFMFRAHREESARARRGSTLSHKPTAVNGLSPFHSPAEHHNIRAAQSVPHNRNSLSKQLSAGSINDEELDSEQGLPIGPAFSTPYQDRIRAARSSQHRPNAQQYSFGNQQSLSGFTLQDRTEALKRFLKLDETRDSTETTGGIMPASQGPEFGPRPLPNVEQRHPYSPPALHPSQSGQTTTAPSEDLRAMENSLKRILKLDVGTPS